MKSFVEFFAGVGLIREGLQQDNWQCIFANDISTDKRDTYVENFGASHSHLGDIWELSDNSSLIPDNAFLSP